MAPAMRTFLTFLWCRAILASAKAQDDTIQPFHITTISNNGILLNKGWKYHVGDSTEWIKPEFDDRNWQSINPSIDIKYLPQVRNAKVCWFL